MRAARLALALLATFAVAACAGDYQPGWTFSPATPPPSVEPSASGSAAPSASAEPSGSAEPSASAEPSQSAEPSSSAPAGDDVVTVSALNVAFEQATLEGPADQAFLIRFENKDAGIPHNVEIRDANGGSLYVGEIFNGVDARDYPVGPFPAGQYQFVCTVHPNMVGTLNLGDTAS